MYRCMYVYVHIPIYIYIHRERERERERDRQDIHTCIHVPINQTRELASIGCAHLSTQGGGASHDGFGVLVSTTFPSCQNHTFADVYVSAHATNARLAPEATH